MQHYGSSTKKLTSLLILSAAIAACGGGGGSSGSPGGNPGGGGPGGGSDSANVTRQVPADVSGFAVTGNEDALYFTQVKDSPEDGSGLYMVETTTGDPVVKAVDTTIGIGFHAATHLDPSNPREISMMSNFISFPEGNVTGNKLDGMKNKVVFYADGSAEEHPDNGYQGFMVSTDGLVDTLHRISNKKVAPTIDQTSHILYSMTNASSGSCLLVPVNIMSTTWDQVCMNNGSATLPGRLEGMTVFTATFDPQAGFGRGYLAINESKGLRFIDKALNDVGPVLDASGSAVGNIIYAADLGMRSADGHQYVALDIEGETYPKVWLYEAAASGAGTIKRVTNNEGEPLLMGRAAFTELGIVVPKDQHVTVMDDDTFFLYVDVQGGLTSTSVDVLRLSGDAWSKPATIEFGAFMGAMATSFLMNAGGHLVLESNENDGGKQVIALLPDGSGRKVLDARGSGVYQVKFDLQPVLGTSADGDWLFYNRFEDKSFGETQWSPVAVALNPATNERLDMAGWTWVGASSNGEGTLDKRLGSEALAQVFMIGPNSELAAVQADDPAGGKVNFGALPQGVIFAEFNGVGLGPRRLIKAISDSDAGGEDPYCFWSQCDYDVLYLDVRDEASLELLTENSRSRMQSPLANF